MAGRMYLLGDLRLDLDARQLLDSGGPVDISSKAVGVLCALAEARGELVTKDALLSRVWPGVVVEENNLQVHVSALRKLLARRAGERVHLVTVPGQGYRLLGTYPEPLRAVSHAMAAGRPTGPSVAVLCFSYLGEDPGQEYFAEGMVEDITTGLSRVRWLCVIGSRSSLSARQQHSDLRELGRELGADYILHGSLRRAGERIRVSTHLCETVGLKEVWSQRYDRKMGDVFELQDEIASSVVAAIEPSLRQAEMERIRRKRPQDLDAYDLVLRALPFVYKLMPEGCRPALPLLQEALRLEPDYAFAHAALAWCHHVMFSRGGLDPAEKAASLLHAGAAIQMGGDDASSLAIGAFVTWFDAHDTRNAFELFDRALAISPSNVLALAASSVALAWSGNPRLAVQRAEQALHLSPFDPLRYLAYLGLSGANLQLGRHEQARDAARHAVESSPGFSVPYAYLCAAFCKLQDPDGAQTAARQLLRMDPAFTVGAYRTTVGVNPVVFEEFAAAWLEAGLPP